MMTINKSNEFNNIETGNPREIPMTDNIRKFKKKIVKELVFHEVRVQHKKDGDEKEVLRD